MPAQRSTVHLVPTAPTRRRLGWLIGVVVLVHLAVLASLGGTLDWQLRPTETTRVSALQTRMLTPPPAPPTAATPTPPAPPARTRLTTEPAKASPIHPPPATEATAETPVQQTQPVVPGTPDMAAHTPAEAPPPAEPPSPQPSPTQPPEAPTTPVVAANEILPLIPLGALPAPTLLSYRLSGQDKGMTYHASGELRWQHNTSDYAMNLSVKAFLIGTRHWRSVGQITAGGLAPTRFSDSWRSERAAHFDRAHQQVVFSGNAPVAELLPGAQDQISLYVQLAAAMAGEPQRFVPGTRLQIQTITVRDAQPWLLTQAPGEKVTIDGQDVPTAKWVCQPRNRFDAQVEFWVAEKYQWLPVRIRITQVSGSYIDLVLNGQEPLPALPAPTVKTPAS
jgi:Protein of unknown function (DUF3108)